MRRRRITALIAAVVLGAGLVACGSDDDTDAGGDTGGASTSVEDTAGGSEDTAGSEGASDTAGGSEDTAGSEGASDTAGSEGASGSDTAGTAESGAESSAGGGGAGIPEGDGQTIKIAIAAGWDEDVAVSHLWKYVLEQHGYKVELSTLDIGPVFIGVSKGDYDLFFDTWLPVTHEDYWKKYGDQVADLGIWYDQATLNIAVPDYMDVNSIADLGSVADQVNGTITGIDSGAGLTRVTRDALKTYGLDGDLTLKTSSTPAMLTALQKAIDAEEPIVVTLWHPHWAYSAFPIKDLEDPEGAMGDAEEIHTIASQQFAEENSDLVDVISNFKMDDETLGSLENTVLQEHKDDMEAGVEAWVGENQEYVDSMTG